MPKRTELRGEMRQVPKQRARCESTLSLWDYGINKFNCITVSHVIMLELTRKDPRLKITIVLKCLITFEPLILSECFKKCRKADILRFSEISHLSRLDFRGSIAYVITSSHFDNIDWSEETMHFVPLSQTETIADA